MEPQQWPIPQTMPLGIDSYLPVPMGGGASSGGNWPTSPQTPVLVETSMMGENFGWRNGSSVEPLIMPASENQFLQNNNLVYGDIVARHQPFEKSPPGYVEDPWQPVITHGLPNSVDFFGRSDLATNLSSPSSRSMFSIPSERGQSFTREAIMDYPSPSESWGGHEAKPCQFTHTDARHDTSLFVTRFDSSGSQSIQQGEAGDIPRLRHQNFVGSFSHSSIFINHAQNSLDPQSTPQYGVGRNIDRVPQWYASDPQSLSLAVSYAEDQEHPNSPFVDESQSSAPIYPSPPPQYAEQHIELTTRTCTRIDTQLSPTPESRPQRQDEDKMLLEGKAGGLTYKEIKKKMRTSVAESTLRGRYRSLTKDRKDRVRKPVWTEKDVCTTDLT